MKKMIALIVPLLFSFTCKSRTESTPFGVTSDQLAAVLKHINKAEVLFALDNPDLDEGLVALSKYATSNKKEIQANPSSHPSFLTNYLATSDSGVLKSWANDQINYDVHFIAGSTFNGSLIPKRIFLLDHTEIYSSVVFDEIPRDSFEGDYYRWVSILLPKADADNYLNIELKKPTLLDSVRYKGDLKTYFFLDGMSKQVTKSSWIKEPPLSYQASKSKSTDVTNFTLIKSQWALIEDGEYDFLRDVMIDAKLVIFTRKIKTSAWTKSTVDDTAKDAAVLGFYQISKKRIAILKSLLANLESYSGELAKDNIVALKKLIESIKSVDAKANDFQF